MLNSEAEKVLEIINSKHRTSFKIIKKYQRGENGAYLISEQGKNPLVLKFCLDIKELNLFDSDINLPKLVTNRLRALEYPVPEYFFSGNYGSEGAYWIQQELLGASLEEAPTQDQLKKIFYFLELQKDQAVSTKQNWSNYIKHVIFRDKKGWIRTLKVYSSATADLLKDFLDWVEKLDQLNLNRNDIVHGDYSYENVLTYKGEVSGVVDWQESGCGEVLLDISRIVYRLHDRSYLAPLLVERLKGENLLKVKLYITFTALEMVAYKINKNPNLEGSINKARSALLFVENLIKS